MFLDVRIIELYKNNQSQLSKILSMFDNIKTRFEIIKEKSKNNKLIFYNQKGGKINKIKLLKTEFYYNIEYAKAIDANTPYNEVYLLTVNEGINGCGLILIDKERKEANVQSVADYSDCVICKNSETKYKVGAIMMQIIIYECKKLKMKKITLEDNSKKNFTGSSIELIYYRTIAQGLPYYCKFGFINIIPLIVRKNKEIWEKKPKIRKNKLIEILINNIPQNEKKLIDLFKFFLKDYKDDIIAQDFLIKLFDKAINKEKEITNRRNNGEIIKNINTYARILYLIIKKLYNILGYEPLVDNKFILFI